MLVREWEPGHVLLRGRAGSRAHVHLLPDDDDDDDARGHRRHTSLVKAVWLKPPTNTTDSTPVRGSTSGTPLAERGKLGFGGICSHAFVERSSASPAAHMPVPGIVEFHAAPRFSSETVTSSALAHRPRLAGRTAPVVERSVVYGCGIGAM